MRQKAKAFSSSLSKIFPKLEPILEVGEISCVVQGPFFGFLDSPTSHFDYIVKIHVDPCKRPIECHQASISMLRPQIIAPHPIAMHNYKL